MELTDFLTESFIRTFSGTLISVELIVFVTKELPIIKKIPTRIYTFVLAFAHLILVKVSASSLNLNVQSGYLLVLNAMVIAVILCGGYDTVMANIKGIVDKSIGSETSVKTANEISEVPIVNAENSNIKDNDTSNDSKG